MKPPTLKCGTRGRSCNHDGGFSLVELAVYIVLLGIVSAVVVAVALTSFRAEESVSGTTSIANNAQTVIANLDRDIRNSPTATPTSGTTQELTLCVAGSGNTLTWHRVVWNFSGNEITRSVDGGTASKILPSPIDSGLFDISGESVRYSFSLSEDGTAKRTFSGTTTLSPATEEGCP